MIVLKDMRDIYSSSGIKMHRISRELADWAYNYFEISGVKVSEIHICEDDNDFPDIRIFQSEHNPPFSFSLVNLPRPFKYTTNGESMGFPSHYNLFRVHSESDNASRFFIIDDEKLLDFVYNYYIYNDTRLQRGLRDVIGSFRNWLARGHLPKID